jgi:RNA polymerase sigma factor (sigma-70 family)
LDNDLVVAAQRGDREAFSVLARANGDRLFTLAHRILRDVDRAEDATQQTLVIAWRELRRLRDPDRFDGWLQRILVNCCYAEAGRARRESGNVRVLVLEPAAPGDHALDIAHRDELERGFRRLPPEQRAILVMHHYLGLTPADIAETLGIPAGTARSRLHYAHAAMRAALEADARTAFERRSAG